MKYIETPVSCDCCNYGKTIDYSIDDLCTHCYITDLIQDWCDFPNREDGTLRQRNCPLPNITDEQFQIADKLYKEGIIRQRLFRVYLHCKKKSVKLRRYSRLKKYLKD